VQSRKILGKEKDVFTPRFGARIHDTVALLKGASKSDKVRPYNLPTRKLCWLHIW
jgi:hypothetical protein